MKSLAMTKSLWRVTVFAGLLVAGVMACARTPAAPDSRAALEAAVQRWTTAVNARDVATLTALMTEDVELSNDSATVTGRDAAIRALRDVVAPGRLVATTRELTMANDVAWHVVGLTQVQKNGDVQPRGRALEIWKHVNGEWRLHRRMAAGVLATPDSLTRPSTKEPVLDRPTN